MNPVTNEKLALATAVAAIALTGCDNTPSQSEELAYLDQAAGTEVRSQIASEEQDLKKTVTELQTKDPSVKDAYYGVNEAGEKELHIVREEADGTNVSDTIWPLVGGMATGYLLAQAMNSHGGYSNYSYYNPPRSYSSYANTHDERRKRRNIITSGYTGVMMNNARNTIRMSPNYRSNMTKSVVSTRSSGIFKSSVSSRSSGYSAGS